MLSPWVLLARNGMRTRHSRGLRELSMAKGNIHAHQQLMPWSSISRKPGCNVRFHRKDIDCLWENQAMAPFLAPIRCTHVCPDTEKDSCPIVSETTHVNFANDRLSSSVSLR